MIARLPVHERYAAVRPYQGRTCDVTFRRGTYLPWETRRYRVIGATWHATNGNSTGDLIVAPATDGQVFVMHGCEVPMLSISLANVRGLDVAEVGA